MKIDGNYDENVQNIINEFNQDKKLIKNRIDLRNFFNSIVGEL